jgi:hypothetical protein
MGSSGSARSQAALSIVHVNRTVQTLRSLNVLSKTSRTIEVADRKQLARIARFDGRYLNMPQLVSKWAVQVGESAPGNFQERGRFCIASRTNADAVCAESKRDSSPVGKDRVDRWSNCRPSLRQSSQINDPEIA